MTKAARNQDEFVIDKQTEFIEFVKPRFARSWALAVYWLLLVGALYYYMETHWYDTYLIHFLFISTGAFGFYKIFTSPYKIYIRGQVVKVYSYHPIEPIKEYHFNKMTSWIETDSVYFMQKGKYFGGTDLRRVYWWPHWTKLREVFLLQADSSIGFEKDYKQKLTSTSTKTASHLSRPPAQRALNPVLMFKIMVETLSLPYLMFCRTVFGVKHKETSRS